MKRRSSALTAEFAVMLLIVAFVSVASAPPVSADAVPQLSTNPAAAGIGLAQWPWYYCYPWNYSYCYPYYYWGYYPYYYYYSYYYYPTTTTTTPKSFELKVQTNPSGVAVVNGAGTYSQGNVASFSVTSLIVPVSDDQRYVFSNWSGDFSGSTPSGTLTMDAAKTVVANYEIENRLRVSIDPPGITSAVGDGWYSVGESVTVGAVPQQIPGGEGARYVFQYWTVDGVAASGNPVTVSMDVPHRLVAEYKTEYRLTVFSDYGVAQGGGWYDAGATATFSVQREIDVSYGVKQVFEKWTGDVESTSATETVTVDSPLTVRAVWRTDSTILYATIAAGVIVAFALGIALMLLLVMPRWRQGRLAPAAAAAVKPTPAPTPSEPAAVEKAVPEKLKPVPTKKRVKTAPPKTEPS